MLLPSRIYLSGAGICAMAHVGALQELSTHIPLSAVKEWMGVSAGAFVSMCVVIGFTLEELYEFSVRFDLTNIKEPDSITGWILHFGMDTGERLHRLVNACLHVKGLSSEITFRECKERFGVSLRILATDLNTTKGICFSPNDTPNYPVSNAVRASMTYPYYFQPVHCHETGHLLVDGAITSNYPMYLLPKEEYSRTLSIMIRISIPPIEDMSEVEPEQLVIRPLYIALTERTNIEISMYPIECIKIHLGNINVLDFSLEEAVKLEMVEKGRLAVREYLKTRPPPQRRKSL